MTAARTLIAVPRGLTRFVDLQAGVVTRDQLARAGLGEDKVRAAVAARRWQTLGRRVVVLHNAALTALQRLWVAVLLPDQPTALAGATAASVGGLRGFDDEKVHILVAGSCGVAPPPWVEVHNSRRFSPVDIVTGPRLPRVSMPRALVDSAAWGRSPRRACAVLCAGVQQRLTIPSALSEELTTAGSVRHVKIMRAIVGDISGGGHTLAEIDLAPLARRAGLPPPRRQVLRRERGGRKRYIDAEFDLPDGSTLLVEIDGAGHTELLTWEDDLDRQNELAIVVDRMLRFASVTVRLDPDRVVDQLSRMRRAHTP